MKVLFVRGGGRWDWLMGDSTGRAGEDGTQAEAKPRCFVGGRVLTSTSAGCEVG
jgi:hypothetical protein